ncbi:MAG: peroxiredoxin [Cellulosilyticaceae bacterium]
MEAITMPLIGDRFPDMIVQTTQGVKKLPDDYKGKWFVLFSHPGDFTPVCTTEFVAFSKDFNKYQELGTELIGLSIDQVFAHMKWLQWIEENLGVKVPFPVIADASGEVAKKLGMIHPNKGSQTVRAVFIVDPNSIIRMILYYPQEIGRNMDEILRALLALQVADKNAVATPADWPNNDLIGSEVIIPPPRDIQTAQEREGWNSCETCPKCYDWWFCHKPLIETKK